MEKSRNVDSKTRFRNVCKMGVSLIPMLGLQWLLGFSVTFNAARLFQYLYVIFVSTQGSYHARLGRTTLKYVYLAITSVAFLWLLMQALVQGQLYRRNVVFDAAVRLTTNRTVTKLPMIYLITATHHRWEQKADLTRFSYTLRHVPNIHWIVIEDSSYKTSLVKQFLESSKLPYTHLNITSTTEKQKKSTHRGVLQRNAGLAWIRSLEKPAGVVYFADDDNTYNIQVFEEGLATTDRLLMGDTGKRPSMRYTNSVSVWPVGLVSGILYEAPVIRNNKVTGWYSGWKPDREFAIDMAGFAINVKLFLDRPNANFLIDSKPGMLETDILQGLGIAKNDLEPKANMCTKIYVWHTQTKKSGLQPSDAMLKLYKYNSTAQFIEV